MPGLEVSPSRNDKARITNLSDAVTAVAFLLGLCSISRELLRLFGPKFGRLNCMPTIMQLWIRIPVYDADVDGGADFEGTHSVTDAVHVREGDPSEARTP